MRTLVPPLSGSNAGAGSYTDEDGIRFCEFSGRKPSRKDHPNVPDRVWELLTRAWEIEFYKHPSTEEIVLELLAYTDEQSGFEE